MTFTVSSLWSLAFIRLFWNLRLPTRWQNIGVAFAGTFVVYVLTTFTLWWLLVWAPMALAPVFAANVSGGAWALVVGTWRWRALQKQQLAIATAAANQPAEGQPVPSQSSEKRPALLGLRAIEILGIGVVAFMLIALVIAAVFFYLVIAHPR